MAHPMPDDMPKPNSLTNDNNELRALLFADAARAIEADDLSCIRLVIRELRTGLQAQSRHTRYRSLAVTALQEAEHWLLDASREE